MFFHLTSYQCGLLVGQNSVFSPHQLIYHQYQIIVICTIPRCTTRISTTE